LVKTKAINPSIIADLSVYSCILPILIFLILRFNWREKLKWFCFLLIITNFSADLLSGYLSKIPIASGVVMTSSADTILKKTITLQVKDGQLHEEEYILSDSFAGIITDIQVIHDKSPKTIQANIQGNNQPIIAGSSFKAYSTLYISNISYLISLIFTFLIFYLIFRDTPPWNKLALIALIGTIAIWLFRNIMLNKLHSFGGFFNGGTTILIILFAIAFFYYQLNKPDIPFIYSSSSFWIVTGILLYKAGTFFLFLYVNTLDQDEKMNFFLINSGFYDIQNILFAIAFSIRRKENKKTLKLRSLQ
jgi:hypothetical protein